MPRKRPKDMRLGLQRGGKRGGPNHRKGETDPTLTPTVMHTQKRPRKRQ